jgi:hypothetical protein
MERLDTLMMTPWTWIVLAGVVAGVGGGLAGSVMAETAPAQVPHVEIDFETCAPVSERVYLPFGSTTYQLVGHTPQGCVMLYGSEVEDRTWDGFLNRMCVVPKHVGRRAFEPAKDGVDLSSIESYCTETPRP